MANYASRCIGWQDNYISVFGTVAKPQLDSWEIYLQANCPNLSNEEIDKAVASMCDNWAQRERPTIKDITSKILANRGHVGAYRTPEQEKWTQEYRKACSDISKMDDLDDIWIVICKTSTSVMGEKVEEYARRLKGFDRSKCKKHQQYIKEFAQCMKVTLSAFADRSKQILQKDNEEVENEMQDMSVFA